MLLLIRHGVTDQTGTRLIGWTPGISLNARGRAQAEAIAARLEGLPISAVYSSPLERCRETAEPLSKRRGRRIRVREGLGEVRYGTWTNRTLKQLQRTKLWRRVQFVPSGMRFPGGESLQEVQTRAVAEFERIADAHPDGAVACFSHADVIKLVVAHYGGVPLDLFQRIEIAPASVSIVVVGSGVPRLLRLNDAGPIPDLAPQAARGPRSRT